jgi:anti-sigma B factor antagonist
MGPAAFEVESIADDVELVAVIGELDLSNAFEFRRRVETGLRSRGSAVVVDLSGVTHMDSSGLAALIDAHQAVQERRGRLALVVSSEPVRRTIEVRGLDRVFKIFATREDALKALAALAD